MLGSNNIDILTLSETHITENIYLDDKNELYKIQGYLFRNHGQSKQEGRGVGIFLKEGVDCKRFRTRKYRNNVD